MERSPFFRPEAATAPPTPEGWVAEPFGVWAGREAVLVFDPRRHDVLLLKNRSTHKALDALVAAGWEPEACDGQGWLWVRDRFATTRIDDRRSVPARAATVEGLSR